MDNEGKHDIPIQHVITIIDVEPRKDVFYDGIDDDRQAVVQKEDEDDERDRADKGDINPQDPAEQRLWMLIGDSHQKRQRRRNHQGHCHQLKGYRYAVRAFYNVSHL